MLIHHLLGIFPPALALLVLTAIPTAGVTYLHYLFRKRVPPDRLLPHHDVAGFLVAVVAVMYAVTLGFLVVTVSVEFDSAQRNADTEAGEVAEAIAISEGLPGSTRGSVVSMLADYALEVRDVEWPLLQQARQDTQARWYLREARRAVEGARFSATASNVEALREDAVRRQVLDSLRNISVGRRQRLIDAANHLPPVLYLALFLGGALVLAFVFLFGVTDARLQLTMTALVTAAISLLFALMFLLDRPYSGSYIVSNDAWTLVIENNELHHTPARVP